MIQAQPPAKIAVSLLSPTADSVRQRTKRRYCWVTQPFNAAVLCMPPHCQGWAADLLDADLSP
jgi:hypothetical protein